MIGTKRSWTGRAAAAAMVVGLALATSAVVAAPAAEVDRVIVPSANALMRFYPTQLSSTPGGAVEDKEAWMAKVQGLMAGAPSLLQHSLLMSQSKQEFAANVSLLQQLQKGSLDSAGLDLKHQAKSGRVGKAGINIGQNGSSDLVYTTLVPCRIMDTRSASDFRRLALLHAAACRAHWSETRYTRFPASSPMARTGALTASWRRCRIAGWTAS